ncbi:MAG: glycosyltransferase family A protein [bacterium]|nr:glycosyltransferase family A protein [bacterium]MDA1024368.1 glycosyltransferase family A protein [bacterium]
MPKISAIIPTYQHATSLPACIDSLLVQEGVDLEIIVVDDGSTDSTKKVLEVYENRLTAIHQDNQGSNFARNRGAKSATGDYFIFVDADIVMKPYALKKMLVALTSSTASYAYSGFYFGGKRFKPLAFDEEQLKSTNFIHTTSLIRAEDFPGFDESVRRLQDWDLWLTMLAEGKTGICVPEYLYKARIDGASRIGTQWMPKIAYKIPWKRLGFMPKAIQKYEAAKKLIKKKHQL